MQLFTNNATSKLASNISNVALSLQVTTGEGSKFPSPTGGDYFLVTLSKVTSGIESAIEIVKVTARSSDVFTIVRAQEGTTGLSYLLDDRVSLRLTAATNNANEVHIANTSNPHTVTQTQVGLSNVDNTTDANKPVSTATQTALNLKANLASPTFTGTVAGITKTMVGLSSVDNTADTAKPVSTLQAAAIAAVVYTHPANHAPSVITQDASNRFVTDAEKTTWNAKGVGDVTLIGTQTLTNKTFTGFTETVYSLTGTVIAVANGTIQYKTLSANTTFTESLADGQAVTIMVSPSTYTITWPVTATNWVGGVTPTHVASKWNVFVLWQISGTVYGNYVGAMG